MQPLKIYSKTIAFNNDLLTPIAAFLKLNQQDGFFLESVEKGHAVGQFSMIGFDPLYRVQGYADYITTSDNENQTMVDGNPLNELSKIYKRIQHHQDGETPVKIGFFGYFSWEVIQTIESIDFNLPNQKIFDFQIPKILIVFDHAKQMLSITETDFQPIRSTQRIENIYKNIRSPIADSHFEQVSMPSAVDWDHVESNWSKDGYESAVLKVKEHIREGDIFQAVISQRFSVPHQKDSLSVYRTLRHINPSPYMFYFNYGEFKLIGSSPEILVKCTDGVATLRPIAGTRKRTFNNEEALVAELKADEKEVAEH
ncbi:MAG: chorismate-binding protein, partial [Candidatus Margulisiibacteriota bacterium]